MATGQTTQDSDVQKSCHELCEALLAEPDQQKQLEMAFGWIIDMAKAKKLDVVPPLDAMLGLKR